MWKVLKNSIFQVKEDLGSMITHEYFEKNFLSRFGELWEEVTKNSFFKQKEEILSHIKFMYSSQIRSLSKTLQRQKEDISTMKKEVIQLQIRHRKTDLEVQENKRRSSITSLN